MPDDDTPDEIESERVADWIGQHGPASFAEIRNGMGVTTGALMPAMRDLRGDDCIVMQDGDGWVLAIHPEES